MTATPERPRDILMGRGSPRALLGHPERTGNALLRSAGVAMVLVGLTELGLLWYPFGFGNPAWEFGTVNETFGAIPKAGLGLAVLVYATIRRPYAKRSAARAASLVFVGLALAILLTGLLYARAVPLVFAEAPASAVQAVRYSVIRTTTAIGVYWATCIVLAGVLWRGAKLQ
jgi:hypothetical protein